MKLTVILNGRGGELDRVTIEAKGDDVTSDDLANAIRAANDGRPWILSDGDTLTVSES